MSALVQKRTNYCDAAIVRYVPEADKSDCGLDTPKVPLVAVDQSYSIGALQRAEIKKWWPIIKAAKIKPE